MMHFARSALAASALAIALAAPAFADDVALAAFRDSLAGASRLSPEQRAALETVCSQKLAGDLGSDRRTHASQYAKVVVAGTCRPEFDVLTPSRFPVAKDLFAYSLGLWADMQPFTDAERQATAANWNKAVAGAPELAKTRLAAIPESIRKAVADEVAAKLRRKPEQFGVYMEIGVWKGRALTAEEGAALAAEDLSNFQIYVTQSQKDLADAAAHPELRASIESRVIGDLASTVVSAFDFQITRHHLDTVERFTGGKEPPAELTAKLKAFQKEIQEAAKKPSGTSAAPAKGPTAIKSPAGIPKPRLPDSSKPAEQKETAPPPISQDEAR